ncbi:MAG: hypothetical protein QGH82_05790, partial [Candidatus Woesearchaeota archaeon]|nr:hypothetical protein [Candidatus Woesearchaeota archaeon]
NVIRLHFRKQPEFPCSSNYYRCQGMQDKEHPRRCMRRQLGSYYCEKHGKTNPDKDTIPWENREYQCRGAT